MEHPDHKQLGELPLERRVIRREDYNTEPVPSQGPPGVVREIPGMRTAPPQRPVMLPSIRDVVGQGAALQDAELAPMGLPSVHYVVQSTFDARPINGNDFQHLDVAFLDPNGDLGAPVTQWNVTYTVPAGRVAIIRRFEWTGTEVLADDVGLVMGTTTLVDTVPIFVALLINGVVQTSYEGIYQQEGERDVYAIAGERETITVQINYNSDFGGDITGWAPAWYVEMYGNLIDSRGREKQYEPANQYIGSILK